ncbi:hypothetical protein [Desulfomonile tiedjei]|uniref:Uncharacterized protein n=1 Tax=Desulfomonile tiedjei (strain ATCC 49306 / DSM 6799 / DCB-1) TaxID=706587 RepID=I4CDR7_DESTA|nr:hypothetical protein [Desulfomonile tiedjei]AFM27708.1 hypothetical protein Desti_5098 [Desulfomonile tiedjei DSM 6799]
MRKLKVKVDRKSAVAAFRAGATDADMMEKFYLSAQGLHKLYEKLIALGELDQREVNRRMFASQQSHVVELIMPKPVPHKKAVVDAEQAVKDIRAGYSDILLMQKYNLSAKGLSSLLEQLVASSLIEPYELEKRENRVRKSDVVSDRNEDTTGGGDWNPEEFVPAKKSWLSRLFADHQIFVAALAGGIAGILLVGIFIMILEGTERFSANRISREKERALQAANKALLTEAQDMIKILDAIARNEVSATNGSRNLAYQECLRNCEKNHESEDEMDKVFVINCKKECLAVHSERFKRIREFYH